MKEIYQIKRKVREIFYERGVFKSLDSQCSKYTLACIILVELKEKGRRYSDLRKSAVRSGGGVSKFDDHLRDFFTLGVLTWDGQFTEDPVIYYDRKKLLNLNDTKTKY